MEQAALLDYSEGDIGCAVRRDLPQPVPRAGDVWHSCALYVLAPDRGGSSRVSRLHR
jgi:hypothetical protein